MSSPTRRAAVVVCVALLAVVAGCNAGTTPTDPATTPSATTTPATSATTPTSTTATTSTSTTTPATTTTTGTWSPNAAVEQYPPGVAANGTLTNVTTLLDAHFDATANESMALTVEWTRQNESFVRSYAHGANRTPYYSTFNHTTDGTRITEELYGTRSHSYSRVVAPNRTVSQVLQNTSNGIRAWTVGDTFGPRASLRSTFISGNYSVNGTVERNGRTFVQLTADEVSARMDGFHKSYEGTALVTPDGVVYDTHSSFVQEADDTKIRIESSKTLDTDVDWSGPPSWVAGIPHLSLSVVEDGHALELRNTGGEPLPANASLDVYVRNETESPVYRISRFSADATGTVTTDAQLEPGEAVYVTADAAGNSTSFTLHDERARGSYIFAAAKIYGEHEQTLYSLVTGTESR